MTDISINNYINTSLLKYPSSKLFSDVMITGSIIKDLIEKDLPNSESENPNYKKAKYQGDNYYRSKNDILQRTQTYMANGQELIDHNRSNYKITHNFHKILVDQKSLYLLGKPVKLSGDEKLIDQIKTILTDKFNKVMIELAKMASNEADVWLHIYIDAAGNFKYIPISSKEIIPVYDTRTQTELTQLIRYYEIKVVDSKGKEVSRYKVEVWDKEKVTYFIQDEKNGYVFDVSEPVNPDSHFYSLNNETQEANNWGKIPFIQFKNNSELMTDLELYKYLIDGYDVVRSDFLNNLADIQDAIWVLTNYGHESMSEFITNLKTKKAICVDDGGDAKPITFDIPYQARESMLNGLKKDIFQLGMGVDVTSDSFVGAPSGEALKRLYALLDLKCDSMELEFTSSIKELICFAMQYLNITENVALTRLNDIEITFNRNMIANQSETIKDCQNSKGIISDETIMENHPFVKDLDLEKERLEKEKEAILPALSNFNQDGDSNSPFKAKELANDSNKLLNVGKAGVDEDGPN